MPEDALLTIDEVAEATRLPVATLRYYRHLGTGPQSARLGRRVVYRRSDVDAWVDAHFAADNDHGASR
jgi:predicted DNA-binding transcriptional regulator AlpA